MDAPWYQVLSGALALVAGVVITWLLALSQQRKARFRGPGSALQVSALLQFELSTLKGRASRIPELESELAASARALNAANERKVMLETEVQRLLDLEGTRAFAALELAAGFRTTAARREQVGTLAAELPADRDAVAAIAIRFK